MLKNRHKKILSMISESKLKLSLAMLCMLAIAATTAMSAWLVKPVIDDIFVSNSPAKLKILPLAVIVTYFMRGIAAYGQEYFMSYVGEQIIMRLRNDLYAKIMELPVSFFHREKTGVLMSRIMSDVMLLKNMVSMGVTSSLKDSFSVLGLVCLIFWLDWKMALFAFIVLPVAFFPIVQFGRRVRRVSTGCQKAMASMSSFLHETFAGNKIVKAFEREDYERERFGERTLEIFRLEIKAVIAKSLSSPVMEFLGGAGIAFVIWYGGFKVINGESTPGTFFSFLTAVLMLYDPVKKLTQLNNSVQQGLSATDRIFDIMEREAEIREVENPLTVTPGPHRVTFENVMFRYDDGDHALRDINLEVRAGEILALVGMSGGGKTSLVNLIPRFYDVSGGAILIDGIDIRKFSISSLRKEMAIVTQEPILFNDTVKNNIAYGRAGATDDEIIAAAKAAFAHDFITGFPNGFETGIGELGSRLSGGEKQRICIARALLKDAPILILDEATSSLDTQAEMLVQKALDNLMKGRTTFVIAHRLSTISHADRIIVLKNGGIVEQGKEDELMAKKGEYYKLYTMQFERESASPTPGDPHDHGQSRS